jgi:hypothetical protein
MTRAQHASDEVRPVDMEIGGDDDTPGIAQELTVDDIDDVAFDSSISVEERREDLMNLLAVIRARRTGDLMGDMAAIASHLEDRIASFENPLESDALTESTGMDTDSRSDDDDPADHVDDENEAARIADLAPRQI